MNEKRPLSKLYRTMSTALALTVFMVSAASSFNYVQAKSNPNKFIVTDEQTTNESSKFKINNNDYSISYDLKKLDSETIRLDTITTDTVKKNIEKHTVIYNSNNDYLLYDGKKVDLKVTRTYNT